MNTQEIQETEARIVGVLKSIFDPEIPVNIYDLGLIYEVRVDEEQVVLCATVHELLKADSQPFEGVP